MKKRWGLARLGPCKTSSQHATNSENQECVAKPFRGVIISVTRNLLKLPRPRHLVRNRVFPSRTKSVWISFRSNPLLVLSVVYVGVLLFAYVRYGIIFQLSLGIIALAVPTSEISAGPYWAFSARTQSLPSHPPGLRGTRRACRDGMGCSCGPDCWSPWNDVSKLGNDNSDYILLAVFDPANDNILQSSLLLDHRLRGGSLVLEQVPLQRLHEFASDLFLCFIDRLRSVPDCSSMV